MLAAEPYQSDSGYSIIIRGRNGSLQIKFVFCYTDYITSHRNHLTSLGRRGNSLVTRPRRALLLVEQRAPLFRRSDHFFEFRALLGPRPQRAKSAANDSARSDPFDCNLLGVRRYLRISAVMPVLVTGIHAFVGGT